MTDTVASWHLGFARVSLVEKAEQKIKQANYATFLPMERRRVIKQPCRGQAKPLTIWETHPIFGSYIFIGAREGQNLYDLKSIDELATVLHTESGPRIVPHRVIDALQLAANADGIMRDIDEVVERKRFPEGSIVEYDEVNPFSSIKFRVTEDTGHVVKAVAFILGQLTPIDLPPERLRAVI